MQSICPAKQQVVILSETKDLDSSVAALPQNDNFWDFAAAASSYAFFKLTAES